MQAEAQFALRGISSDSTKYYHVLATLDQDTAVRISDVILNIPANDKFDSLKKWLLQQTFELQETDRAEQLLILASTGLGDCTPSQLMEEILQLPGTKPFCFYVSRFFCANCQQLCAHNWQKQISVATLEQSLTKLPMLWHTAHLDNQLVGKTSGITSPNNELCTITKPNMPSTTPTIHKNWCQFHRRLAKAARKCQKPCSFLGNATAGHQSH